MEKDLDITKNLVFFRGATVTRKNIKVNRWSKIAALVGSSLLALGLFMLAWNSYLIVTTSSLNVTPFILLHEDGGYAANVTDSRNLDVAHIYVRVPSLVYDSATSIPVLVSIWHEEGTKLNSLELSFSSDKILSMALEVAGGYPGSGLEFHRTSDARGVVFKVPDLGLYGTGTVTVEFLTEFYLDSLDLDVLLRFTMQRDAPLTFSRQIVEAQVSTQTSRA